MSAPMGQCAERPGVAPTTPAVVSNLLGGADVAESTCSVSGCARTVDARGWCAGHYRRWRLTGDVGADQPLAARDYSPFVERFWAKVSKGDGCWEWQGIVSDQGYGRFPLPRNGGPSRQVQAHRVAYELSVGVIPDGLVLDHLCRNRRCVNPDHLEPVTNAENVLRGISPIGQNHVKDACLLGHPLDAENTYLHTYVRKSGEVAIGRQCRICRARRGVERRATA